MYIVAESPEREMQGAQALLSPPEPWARHKPRFCKNFEDEVAWLASGAAQAVVSKLKRIERHTAGDIYGRVWKELEENSPPEL